ncbi:hypothetical protein L6452_18248 [Arctium lappa]|uniref:Uncharacterized protein n=1 Tax=Arctium lappa TaxID=4217 RepID=A0ACB9C5I7_ARCLA|nr:hypothetical protein L6452_18248 [Arctium lappa]
MSMFSGEGNFVDLLAFVSQFLDHYSVVPELLEYALASRRRMESRAKWLLFLKVTSESLKWMYGPTTMVLSIFHFCIVKKNTKELEEEEGRRQTLV